MPTLDLHPCPFTILVDQREQTPFHFRGITADAKDKRRLLIIQTRKAHLYRGDYSIEGFDDQIAVERKSKTDLFHCMGSDRERFEEQIKRLNEIPHPYVVVEAPFESLIQGCANSKLDPKVIFRTRVSWEMKYPRVHWWFCPSVDFAEALTYRIFDKFWREKNGRDKK